MNGAGAARYSALQMFVIIMNNKSCCSQTARRRWCTCSIVVLLTLSELTRWLYTWSRIFGSNFFRLSWRCDRQPTCAGTDREESRNLPTSVNFPDPEKSAAIREYEDHFRQMTMEHSCYTQVCKAAKDDLPTDRFTSSVPEVWSVRCCMWSVSEASQLPAGQECPHRERGQHHSVDAATLRPSQCWRVWCPLARGQLQRPGREPIEDRILDRTPQEHHTFGPAKDNYLEINEKSTRFFLQMEKQLTSSKHSDILTKSDGTLAVSSAEIKEECLSFYTKLYRREEVDDSLNPFFFDELPFKWRVCTLHSYVKDQLLLMNAKQPLNRCRILRHLVWMAYLKSSTLLLSSILATPSSCFWLIKRQYWKTMVDCLQDTGMWEEASHFRGTFDMARLTRWESVT